MPHVAAALRRLVIDRARDRCEYCLVAQAGQEASFHIDHVVPVAEGGPTIADNLALACVSCSLRKGARRTAIDPESGSRACLFHPRNDRWPEHFRWEGVFVVGSTAIGRATVSALQMNRKFIIAIRSIEASLGRHPPR